MATLSKRLKVRKTTFGRDGALCPHTPSHSQQSVSSKRCRFTCSKFKKPLWETCKQSFFVSSGKQFDATGTEPRNGSWHWK